MKETQVQRSSVLNYLTQTSSSGGLGYKEVINNQVRKDWFIQEDILSFLKTSNNKLSFEKILKKIYGGDELLFIEDYIQELRNNIIENTTPSTNVRNNLVNHDNIAIFLRKNYKSFKFHNETFHLFYTNNSLINNENFKDNIFSVVEELTYTFPYKNPNTGELVKFRPDLTFFLNGIYFSYNELKLPTQGQSANTQGINKVSNDYKNPYYIYSNMCNKKNYNRTEKENLKRELFWVFDRAIHISVSDFNTMYLIRHIDKGFEYLKKDNLEKYKKFMDTNLSIYPSGKDQKELSSQGKNFKDYFKMLYSKENIINEVLYYNYLEFEYKKDNKGGVIKSRKGKLFAPRNKQKYGVDLTINRIKEYLEQEYNPNFEYDEFKNKLMATKLSDAQQDEMLAEKTKLLNNKNINSILLNYAAGFGKTDVLGLLALQIKDIVKDNKPAFNKIILVSDRIELREQIQEKLFAMYGDSNLVQEARNRKTFKKALKEATIIIVNIQKFNTISKILSDDIKKQLNTGRAIFLIDEIHRSNANKQHEEMTSLFEELNNSFSGSGKKNIVVGLTATANDYVLQRFGEYVGCNSNGKTIYAPFDLYTMKQAVEDGFVLDFSKYVFGVPSTMYYELSPEDKDKILKDKNKYTLMSFKSKIYENEDRIAAVSKHIVKTLMKTTFPSIKRKNIGTLGKGMVAVYSKKAASLYDKWINHHLKLELEKGIYSNPEYKNMKKAKVFTIYSYSKDEDATISNPKELNDGLDERQVVQKFKQTENAVIIVVDKLQTGFNEPTLHTLFLDKEIKGINAIQTCARVNRTCVGKEDCLILDYSVDIKTNKGDKKEIFSPNAEINIPKAMEKYKDTQISDYNFIVPLKELKTIYDKINREPIKIEFYKQYKEILTQELKFARDEVEPTQEFSDNYINNFQAKIIYYLEDNCDRVDETYKLFISYLSLLNKLELTIDFQEENMKKYKNPFLIKLLNIIKNLFNVHCKNRKELLNVNVEYDDITGLIETSLIEHEEKQKKEKQKKENKSNSKHGKFSVIQKIEFLNLKEGNKEKRIQEWENKIEEFFKRIENILGPDNNLKSKVESDSMETAYKLFNKSFRKARQRDENGHFDRYLGDEFYKQILKLEKELWDDYLIFIK